MTDHLTNIGFKKSDALPGMAFFAGTGPAGKTCGDCKLRGYMRQRETGQGAYKYFGCAKFRSMTGRSGQPVATYFRSCKYFEPVPKK